MGQEKPEAAGKQPPRSYLTFPARRWPFARNRAYLTQEALESLKKDHPEAFLEANSVRPDRVQIEGLWYALELPDDEGRRWLVGLK
jgi:hypothetical protein